MKRNGSVMQTNAVWWRALRRATIGLGVLALVSACAQVRTTGSGAVGVERTQYMSSLVSESELQQQANQQYQQILSQARANKQLDPSPAQTKKVQAIMQRLVAQTGVFRQDARNWQWQMHVLKSNEVNAWCMPGGKMAVYTGLIDRIKPTDDELAAVIGHEIAHALREHARERVSQQLATELGLSVLAMISNNRSAVDIGGTLSQVMFTLPNSRANETEADRIGVELAARAGYDPRAAITLWQKMDKLGGGAPPEILSTHPSSASRIKDLERSVQAVLPLYKK